MKHLFITGLAVATIAAAAPAREHHVRVDHPAGPVDALYRADVKIAHRQVGVSGAPGRPSTLRCLWSADMTVNREARHGSGSMMTRSIDRGDVIEGSRSGWCDGHRTSIAREVASRTDRIRQEMVAVAADDHSVLREELDRLHASQRTG